MNASQFRNGFAYALVSAVPVRGEQATRIGIILKAHDRSTIASQCRMLEGLGRLAATYEALMTVLQRAQVVNARRITIYVDDPMVIEQLIEDCEVPRELIGANLRARAMLHQLGRVRLKAANSPRFSARMLAQNACASDAIRDVRSDRQLPLLSKETRV